MRRTMRRQCLRPVWRRLLKSLPIVDRNQPATHRRQVLPLCTHLPNSSTYTRYSHATATFASMSARMPVPPQVSRTAL